MEKFAGVGLVNILIIWMLCMVLTVGAKVLVNKYPIPGLTQVVNAQ